MRLARVIRKKREYPVSRLYRQQNNVNLKNRAAQTGLPIFVLCAELIKKKKK